MFWFKTKPRPSPDNELAARVEALERQIKTIDSEWTDWYEKFRRLHMRLAKRDQRAEDGAEPTNGQGDVPISPLAAQILRRR